MYLMKSKVTFVLRKIIQILITFYILFSSPGLALVEPVYFKRYITLYYIAYIMIYKLVTVAIFLRDTLRPTYRHYALWSLKKGLRYGFP